MRSQFMGVPIEPQDLAWIYDYITGGSNMVPADRWEHYTGETVKNKSNNSLPEDDAERSQMLMADGLLDYFPNALAEVARHSKLAGDKHHPGEQLHWERNKSTDHRNKIMRHLVDSGKKDKDGNRHSTGLAWRALALLQEELEAEFGYPAPRNARD
jgi:hypothetical protein